MTDTRPDVKAIKFPVLQGVLRFLFATKTYTGIIRGKVLWIDGATIKDADIEECALIYLGIGGITFKGDVNIQNCSIVYAGPAEKSSQVIRFFEKEDQRDDEY